MTEHIKRPPMWFVFIILVTLFPVFLWPWLMGYINYDDAMYNTKLLMMLFPIYSVVSSYLSYRSYVERKEVSWILLSLLVMSYISVGVYIIYI